MYNFTQCRLEEEAAKYCGVSVTTVKIKEDLCTLQKKDLKF
jgi:hypothetical protein